MPGTHSLLPLLTLAWLLALFRFLFWRIDLGLFHEYPDYSSVTATLILILSEGVFYKLLYDMMSMETYNRKVLLATAAHVDSFLCCFFAVADWLEPWRWHYNPVGALVPFANLWLYFQELYRIWFQ